MICDFAYGVSRFFSQRACYNNLSIKYIDLKLGGLDIDQISKIEVQRVSLFS